MRTLWMVPALSLLAPPVLAQKTADQARLMLTVSAGYTGGASLWDVSRQPIFTSSTSSDTLAIGRDIRPRIGVGFSGTYFPGEHVGFAVDVFLLGLGLEDSCSYVFSSAQSRSPDIQEACDDLDGRRKPGTAVVVSAGGVYRFASRSPVSPYVRGNAGIVISSQSPIRTLGTFTNSSNQVVDLIIYADNSPTRVNPAFALGAGFTAAVARGYQLRLELRDNITGVQAVDGATGREGLEPSRSVSFRHIFSLTMGFDVVLERKRGRRY